MGRCPCFGLRNKRAAEEKLSVQQQEEIKVEETKYVLEAKIIKRMDILVLSTLEWRMNPTPPLSFIDYITRRLGLKGYLCCEFRRRYEFVLLIVLAGISYLSREQQREEIRSLNSAYDTEFEALTQFAITTTRQ